MDKDSFIKTLVDKYNFPKNEATSVSFLFGNNEDLQKEYEEFLMENNLDLSSIWEIDEKGDKSYSDYEKAILKAYALSKGKDFDTVYNELKTK